MSSIALCAKNDPRLANQPCRITAGSKAYVLWQDQMLQWYAMEDKCPHQHKRLSAGRVENGHLICAFHGWSFSSQGEIVFPPCQEHVAVSPLSIREGWLVIA